MTRDLRPSLLLALMVASLSLAGEPTESPAPNPPPTASAAAQQSTPHESQTNNSRTNTPTGLAPTIATPSSGVSVYVEGAKAGGHQAGPEKQEICCTPLLGFLGKIAWPLVTFVLAIMLMGSGAIAKLLPLIRSVKAGGVEVEFNPADAKRARATIVDTYRDFNRVAREAYAQAVRVHSIRENLRTSVDAIRGKLQVAGHWPSEDYRATIHVPDVVISEFLYQLVDYLPSGLGSGRRFSVRRGIIGRCWRLRCSLGAGDALAPTKQDPATANVHGHSPDDTALVEQWGMTWDEAETWRKDKRHSFLCILLRDSRGSKAPHPPVGILYVDSVAPNAFGTDDVARSVAVQLESDPALHNLGSRVAEALDELREGGTFLDLTSIS
jgi:hypothetical protein